MLISWKSLGLILLGAFLYSIVGSVIKLIFLGMFTYCIVKLALSFTRRTGGTHANC